MPLIGSNLQPIYRNRKSVFRIIGNYIVQLTSSDIQLGQQDFDCSPTLLI